jgi:hypothetical protein
MFYEVTIFHPKNKKKKIISSKKLSENYWADFEKKQNSFSTKKIFYQLLDKIKSKLLISIKITLNIYSRYL